MSHVSNIAIVGGGPGGLTLAALLQRQGFSCTVYERDEHVEQRPQGGTLDLHEGSGLLALRQAGLMPEFSRIARYEDQGTRLMDKDGRLLFADDDAASGDRPEVDRSALRRMLLESLLPGTVRWNSSVHEIASMGDGRWAVGQGDGTSTAFDLVVGADGAWSRVRPLLSRYKPQYTGVTFVEFGIDDVDQRHPALAALVGRGTLWVEGDGRAVIAQRNGESHIRAYAAFRVPVEWAADRFDLSRPARAREQLIEEFDGFASCFIDLFRAAGDRLALRSIEALPVGHHWLHRPGLTLIGDAAHVMSPFGGEGVNNAMLDAAELARHLSSGASLSSAVASYESEMFERVIVSAQGAAEGVATFLSHVGQELALQMYRSHVEATRQQAE
jgi:2-polyprenyl-6-methoxyphenol hydroxylase-like FAD-dependent oxidoreductase